MRRKELTEGMAVSNDGFKSAMFLLGSHIESIVFHACREILIARPYVEGLTAGYLGGIAVVFGRDLQRGAFALLVSTFRAMRRPYTVERATKHRLHVLFMCV